MTLSQLKRRIIRALRHDSATHTVNLVCRLPNNGGYTAVEVTDDEVCEFILNEATRRILIVYVEIEEIRSADDPSPSSQPYRYVVIDIT